MTTHEKHHTPWYLWPFAAIWKLLAVIVEMTGRLVAMILGIVLMHRRCARQPDGDRRDRRGAAGDRGITVVYQGDILEQRNPTVSRLWHLQCQVWRLSVLLRSIDFRLRLSLSEQDHDPVP